MPNELLQREMMFAHVVSALSLSAASAAAGARREDELCKCGAGATWGRGAAGVTVAAGGGRETTALGTGPCHCISVVIGRTIVMTLRVYGPFRRAKAKSIIDLGRGGCAVARARRRHSPTRPSMESIAIEGNPTAEK